jgi:hypothetical protein
MDAAKIIITVPAIKIIGPRFFILTDMPPIFCQVVLIKT